MSRIRNELATPRLTWALIAVNTAIFAAMVAAGVPLSGARVAHLEPWGASSVYLVAAGQWWRLLSAIFLHADIAHLLVNMLGLWLVGRPVERSVGSPAFALIYFFAGLAGMTGMLLTGESSVGASGGLYGLIGCLVVLALRGFPVRRLLLVVLALESVGLLVLCTVPGLHELRVAHESHLVGFVAGLAVSALLVPRHEGASPPRWGLVIACLGSASVIFGGAVAYVLHGQIQACPTRVDRLRARLPQQAPVAAAIALHSHILPASPSGRPLGEPGAIVRVAGGTVFVDEQPQGPIESVDTAAKVASILEILVRHGATDVSFDVLAEAGVEAQVLIDMLRMLPAVYQPRLLVREARWEPLDPVPEGASAELKTRVRELLEAKPEQKSSLLTALFLSANRGCQPLHEVWSRVTAATAAAQEGVLLRDAPLAIETCSCLGVDVDGMEAATLLLVSAPGGPPVRWLPVRFEDSPTLGEQPIALPPAMTVAQLAEGLAAAEAAHRSVYFDRP